MKEFEFIDGSLEAHGLHVGDVLECAYSDSHYFTVGKIYIVDLYDGDICIFDDVSNPCSGKLSVTVKFKPVSKKTKQPDFQNALDYLDTFGIPAEITDKGMHVEGELTKVQWLDFAKILLEGEE